MSSITLGVVMDPIDSINIKKDSTFEMLWQAQERGWQIRYFEMNDLFIKKGLAYGHGRDLIVKQDSKQWFELSESSTEQLDHCDAILMRKDPPFDMEYVYATYILELAEKQGALVVNSPASLRDCNEKVFTAWFPECSPASLITRNDSDIRAFLQEHGDIILKPLDGMGGASIFRVKKDDANISVIIETLTAHQQQYIMAQQFIPEISKGDKRLLVVDGKPVDYVLARIPAKGETRGNLAAGGTGVGQPLSRRDREIANIVAPELTKRGIMFAGLDIIGDYLTEINVTSPTCIKELNKQFDLDIAGDLLQAIEAKIST